MKIRQGFVSNSSSSSFVVACPKPAKDILFSDIKTWFFRDRSTVQEYDTPHDVETLTHIVLSDLEQAKKLTTIEEIAEEVASGWFFGKPERDWNRFKKVEGETEKEYWLRWDKVWEEEKREDLTIAEQIAAEFVDNNRGCHFYVLSYSDNDGPMATQLEHGDHWDNIPTLISSHH